jgi:hypothetical protein
VIGVDQHDSNQEGGREVVVRKEIFIFSWFPGRRFQDTLSTSYKIALRFCRRIICA